MTPIQALFIITSVLLLVSGFMVVTARNLVRAALWLIAALFMVAVVFVLLDAGFLAVVQVVVYIGAIAILFIFAVMLTRRVMQESGPQSNSWWWVAGLFSLLLFFGLTWIILGWGGAAQHAPRVSAADLDNIEQLGLALVDPAGYVVPFEVASVLLLAALIGAIVVAWDRN
ncbi:MAG TPA: NADH-quinone oxidoreductase subunit J [Anaerolineales bacterium]|nr:NADH-quinone oxidoreductase subunit J [Anaerolineales bacterium]